MVSKKQSISFSITLLSSIAVLFIWFSSSFANKYDYADSYEDIVKELTKSEKAIKGFFDSATTKNAKKVILYYESNGKFAIKSIEVPDVKTNPSVNLKIYFDFDKSSILPQSFDILEHLGKAIQIDSLKEKVILINGHTDSTGDPKYNRKLSFQRAESIKKYLVEKHNITPNRLHPQGFGEQLPVADNKSKQGRSLNRRVEIEIVSE